MLKLLENNEIGGRKVLILTSIKLAAVVGDSSAKKAPTLATFDCNYFIIKNLQGIFTAEKSINCV